MPYRIVRRQNRFIAQKFIEPKTLYGIPVRPGVWATLDWEYSQALAEKHIDHAIAKAEMTMEDEIVKVYV